MEVFARIDSRIAPIEPISTSTNNFWNDRGSRDSGLSKVMIQGGCGQGCPLDFGGLAWQVPERAHERVSGPISGRFRCCDRSDAAPGAARSGGGVEIFAEGVPLSDVVAAFRPDPPRFATLRRFDLDDFGPEFCQSAPRHLAPPARGVDDPDIGSVEQNLSRPKRKFGGRWCAAPCIRQFLVWSILVEGDVFRPFRLIRVAPTDRIRP